MSGRILFPLSGHVLLPLRWLSGHVLYLFSGYGLWPLILGSGDILYLLKPRYHLIELLPENLEVVGVFPASPHDGNDPPGQKLSPCCLLFPLGEACFLAHLSLTLIDPPLRICAFV